MGVNIYKVEYTRYGNPTVRSAPALAPIASQRRLKLPRIIKWYTKEQLEYILNKSWYGLKETRFDEIYRNASRDAKKKSKRHKFTELEDLFIRNNYQYLPDSVIALALNIPVNKVISRRAYLGYTKVQQADDKPFVIVWDNRDKFDKDLAKEGLTLLREGLRW